MSSLRYSSPRRIKQLTGNRGYARQYSFRGGRGGSSSRAARVTGRGGKSIQSVSIIDANSTIHSWVSKRQGNLSTSPPCPKRCRYPRWKVRRNKTHIKRTLTYVCQRQLSNRNRSGPESQSLPDKGPILCIFSLAPLHLAWH